MNIKKTISLTMAVAMLATGVACGNSEVSSNSSTTSSQSTIDATGEKIVYWSMWNATEPQGMVIQEAADAFKEKTGVEVEINWAGRDVNKIAQPAIESGERIDITDSYYTTIANTYGDNNLLLPLDEYVTKTYETTNGKPYNEVVDGKFIETVKNTSVDGILYGIPYQPFFHAFFYSVEAFEKAGVEKAPTTWGEFMDVCEKLKVAGYAPVTTDDAYLDLMMLNHMNRLVGVDEYNRILKEEEWDNPAFMRAFSDFETMAKNGYLSPFIETNKWPAGQQELALGEAAIYLNGSWLPNEVLATTGPDFKWGAFTYPSLEGGVSDQSTGHFASQAFGVPKTAENIDMAVEFMVFLTTGAFDEKMALDSAGIPMDKSSQWPTILDGTKDAYYGIKSYEAHAVENLDKIVQMKSLFATLSANKITPEEMVEALKAN